MWRRAVILPFSQRLDLRNPQVDLKHELLIQFFDSVQSRNYLSYLTSPLRPSLLRLPYHFGWIYRRFADLVSSPPYLNDEKLERSNENSILFETAVTTWWNMESIFECLNTIESSVFSSCCAQSNALNTWRMTRTYLRKRREGRLWKRGPSLVMICRGCGAWNPIAEGLVYSNFVR